MTRPVPAPFIRGETVAFSTVRPGGDRPNQDGLAVVPVSTDRGVLAVADGLGDAPAGDRAAALALRSVQSSVIIAGQEDGDLAEAVAQAFERSHRLVEALGGGAATTLLAAVFEVSTLRVFHAGDSELAVFTESGVPRYRSHPPGDSRPPGASDGAAGREDDGVRLAAWIGNGSARVETSEAISLGARETVFLASDGLLANLGLDELGSIVCGSRLADGAGALVTRVHERMSEAPGQGGSEPDDVSFLAFRAPDPAA